jgi:hypothetical protein
MDFKEYTLSQLAKVFPLDEKLNEKKKALG